MHCMYMEDISRELKRKIILSIKLTNNVTVFTDDIVILHENEGNLQKILYEL
jgi:hypothetical protein